MLQQDQIQKLVELTKKEIVDIRQEGQTTVVEFDDGQILPLFGGGTEIADAQPEPVCSFCGTEQSRENPLMAPPEKSEPCICSKCACRAVELFVYNGVDVELDLPITEDTLVEKKK